MNVFNY